MEFDAYVIQDDVSRYGLRRRHLMRSRPFGEEEIASLKTLAMTEGRSENDRGGSSEVEAFGWEDEVGNAHLYLAWRCLMEVMVVCHGVFGEAVVSAARGYVRRFGELPNRVVVREGMEAPEEVELRTTEARKAAQEVPNDEALKNEERAVLTDEGIVRARVERVKWLRMGDVGVYVAAGGESIGDSGGLPDEGDRRVEV